MLERSRKRGVMDGTPNVLHVLIHPDEDVDADTRIRRGASHRVANAAIRTPRSMMVPSTQDRIARSKVIGTRKTATGSATDQLQIRYKSGTDKRIDYFKDLDKIEIHCMRLKT